MVHFACYRFPIGPVTVGYAEDAVVFLKIGRDPDLPDLPSPFSDLVARQLQEYLSGTRKEFTFPIRLTGTDFQKTVWEELRRIPYGQTRTYGQIAAAIGNPRATQAVGLACGKNPVWIAVPGGLELKQQLLDIEK